MKKIKNLKRILIIILFIICMGISSFATSYLLNATQVSYGSGSVKTALDDLYAKAPKYTVGQLVRYGNEDFYVLSESKDKVELFAKTNINLDCTAQANAVYGSTACAFSSTSSYWSSLWTGETIINLNNINGFTDTDAIGRARKYARLKGAISGRLLTYEEANSLIGSYAAMIYGYGNTAQMNNGHGFENYWLGSMYVAFSSAIWRSHNR